MLVSARSCSARCCVAATCTIATVSVDVRTEEMISLFHSLGQWGPGRGRTAAAVAFFGGGAACRNMLKEVEDTAEKIKLATYVASILSEQEASVASFWDSE